VSEKRNTASMTGATSATSMNFDPLLTHFDALSETGSLVAVAVAVASPSPSPFPSPSSSPEMSTSPAASSSPSSSSRAAPMPVRSASSALGSRVRTSERRGGVERRQTELKGVDGGD